MADRLSHYIRFTIIITGLLGRVLWGECALGLAIDQPIETRSVQFLVESDAFTGLDSLIQSSPSEWQDIGQYDLTSTCGRTHWGRVTIFNPSGDPTDIVLGDRWLLTRELTFYQATSKGTFKKVHTSFKSSKNQFFPALIRHSFTQIEPGESTLYFRYHCFLKGNPEIFALREEAFFQEFLFKNLIWSGFVTAIFFVFVYGMVFYLFTRKKIYLYVASFWFHIFLSNFLFLHFSAGIHRLESEHSSIDKRTFVLTLISTIFSYFFYVKTHIVKNDINSSNRQVFLFFPVLIFSAPLSTYFPETVLQMTIGVYFVLLFAATIKALVESRHLDTLESGILLGTQLYAGISLVYEDSVNHHSYWLLPLGYFLAATVSISNLGVSELKEYLHKKHMEFKKDQNQIDLRVAEEVQKLLLADSPSNDSFASIYKPADPVGGDWYSYFYSHDRRYVNIFIGDITGHSIGSAYAMSVVWGALETIKNTIYQNSYSPEESIRKSAVILNQVVHRICSDHERLMTAMIVCIDLKDEKFHLFNGGHYPLIIANQGGFKTIRSPGNLVGLDRDINPKVLEFGLKPGDLFCLYTDGLFEVQNKLGAKLKRRDLGNMLSESQTAAQLMNKLMDYMEDPSRESSSLHDDITVLVYHVESYGEAS